MNCAPPVLFYLPWARRIVPLQQTLDRRDAYPTEERLWIISPSPSPCIVGRSLYRAVPLPPREDKARYLKWKKKK